MLDALVQFDQSLTLSINQAYSAAADSLMIIISDKKTWIPLYLAILILINKLFGWKRALIIVVAIVLNVVLTDQISVMMKEGFMRLRPCHHHDFSAMLHLADGCGGRYGFVSSHAANTMGLAVLVALILKNRWMTFGMLCFAILNGYSRIYLGQHYFFDVLAGYLLGIASAVLVYRLLKWSIKNFKL